MRFNESTLEKAVIELFVTEGYEHIFGEQIHKEMADVLIKEDIYSFLRTKYIGDKLTDNEISAIIRKLEYECKQSLYEANKTIMNLIANGFVFKREDSSKKDLFIHLIDFDKENNKNIFKIVNQMEIAGTERRIPDAIVYINGLPVVVIEFKSAVKENATIMNAYTQLTVRYKRDIPDLFKYNAFVVISDGVNNKYGSLFTNYEYFYSWRKIDDKEKDEDGINSLYTMVKGLFRKERLVEVIRNFVYFCDSSIDDEKIVCRYPQYFAATKLYDSIKVNMKPKGSGKGGTYFGATGCGKSYTMLFLTRLLMKSRDLSSPTIILITDRTDLDVQLSKQFLNSKQFIGDENVNCIESRENLKEELKDKVSGGVYLTTIQKFTENANLLSDRNNIIVISDEAHRSQVNLEQKIKRTKKGLERKYGFAKYLHDSFPNATYVGFTGTPIDATYNVFGESVDSYTMVESVKDGITVNIVYEGRAAKVLLDNAKLKEIEEYYKLCEADGANEYQVEESQKAMAHMEVIIGDENRLKAVAEDFVKHYENRVFEKATVKGKAMFVCMNREIAYNLYKQIKILRPEWVVAKECDDGAILTDKDKRELKPIEKIKLVMTRSADDDKDLFDMLGTNEYKKELDRQFKNNKSNFKIAIVVDMWLTGFDVPSLDTMYIDKPVAQHNLIQTISRVNRVFEGKDKGLIIDYIGIKRNMNLALRKYNDEDGDVFEGVEESVVIVKDQLDLINRMMARFDAHDFYCGSPLTQLECLKRAVEFVQRTEDLEQRFMAAVKRLKSAYNLCSSSESFSDKEKDSIYFYLAIRSVLFKYIKGEAPDIAQMNAKVRKLIEEALISDGVEELFKINRNSAGRELDIFSEEYLEKIAKIKLPNTRIKILEKLLQDAIEEYKKSNKIKAVEFSKRLKAIVDKYNERKDDLKYMIDVLDNVAESLSDLLRDLKSDRDSFMDIGIDFEEKVFYDILKNIATKFDFEFPENKTIELAKEIKKIVDNKAKYTDWSKRPDIKSELKVDLILLLAEYGYPPVTQDDVFKEIFEQAENFKKYR